RHSLRPLLTGRASHLPPNNTLTPTPSRALNLTDNVHVATSVDQILNLTKQRSPKLQPPQRRTTQPNRLTSTTRRRLNLLRIHKRTIRPMLKLPAQRQPLPPTQP